MSPSSMNLSLLLYQTPVDVRSKLLYCSVVGVSVALALNNRTSVMFLQAPLNIKADYDLNRRKKALFDLPRTNYTKMYSQKAQS